jgi:hypothetical protein
MLVQGCVSHEVVEQLINENDNLRSIVRFAMNTFHQIQGGRPVDVATVLEQLELARRQSELVALNVKVKLADEP